MTSNDLEHKNIEGLPSKEYSAVDVEKEFKREGALFSQAIALIFFLLFVFFIFFDQSNTIVIIETTLSGVVLLFSALAMLVIILQSWEDLTGTLKFSLSLVLILTFGALVFDALNPLAAVMFQYCIPKEITNLGIIIVLMLLPLCLFPGLFLAREDMAKTNIKSLWLFVISVIPLLIIRVVMNPDVGIK